MSNTANHSATYSPEDNKLRLYPASRLDADDYAKVKEAGFRWAPRQELFVAPMWTPAREDLLIAMCGDIGDEDESLADRAEERADRFEQYSENRAKDADQAHESVSAITDGIPLGQPILVGHHSEKRARKDAQRIDNGMRKAVKMWECSQYWKQRAAGALSHAKYKERPDVRQRRIKKIEAEIRKHRAEYTPAPKHPTIMQTAWGEDEKTPHVWCGKGRGGRWVKRDNLPKIEAANARRIAHNENRLIYERAMLDEQGGSSSSRWDIEPGGQVLIRGDWLVVVRVNKSTATGELSSVTTGAPARMSWRDTWTIGIERVKDYKPPSAEQKTAVKKATAKPPLCNYPGKGFQHITKAEWKRCHRDYKSTKVFEATETAGRHRVRYWIRSSETQSVFITDQAEKRPPKAAAAPAMTIRDLPREKDVPTIQRRLAEMKPATDENVGQVFTDIQKVLDSGGVQVVTAPQLFPTPSHIARRVVELADVQTRHLVLEPSAGTGALCWELLQGQQVARLEAVEINQELAERLRNMHHFDADKTSNLVHCRDFLECNGDLGKFDRIIMNPPYKNGEDIKHIRHAQAFLKPGGRLVAICANGPRQRKAFIEDEGREWHDLPAGSFADSGTNVNAAIVVIDN